MNGLVSGFLRSCERHGDRPALVLGPERLGYAELYARAAGLAAALESRDDGAGDTPLTAILGNRSTAAFSGVLAALLRGHGYVPLNPAFPPERCRSMLERSGARELIVDEQGARMLEEILEPLEPGLTVVLPGPEHVDPLAERWPGHRFVGAAELRDAPAGWSPSPARDPEAIAYLLFTSGSTGRPKGVGVTHANVRHFVDFMVERYGIGPDDRLSQMFDLTFDLSVFDMFVGWERGACLCCPTAQEKMLPGKYVARNELSVWFSVPSTGVMMSKLRMLEPGAYPSLRFSLFCGEALPVDLAERWQLAAPASTIENLYGPTELTIACSLYRWQPSASPAEAERGVVPIGEPYPSMRELIADDELRPVDPGEPGELLMAGPQCTPGYWRDPERTSAAFVVPPGADQVHYRTGDRVRRPVGGPLLYMGRVDHQVKIQGYRVELGEIESVLREAAQVDVAVALGWPVSSTGAEGVVGFVLAEEIDEAEVIRLAQDRLPAYMVPRRVHALGDMPLNANGKVDRNALAASLQNPDGGSAP